MFAFLRCKPSFSVRYIRTQSLLTNDAQPTLGVFASLRPLLFRTFSLPYFLYFLRLLLFKTIIDGNTN